MDFAYIEALVFAKHLVEIERCAIVVPPSWPGFLTLLLLELVPPHQLLLSVVAIHECLAFQVVLSKVVREKFRPVL